MAERRCVTCDGYGHTCVLTPSGLRLLVLCEGCGGDGWLAVSDQEAAQDEAALKANERSGGDGQQRER